MASDAGIRRERALAGLLLAGLLGAQLAAISLAGCGDTLVEHDAPAELLRPVVDCAPDSQACGGACYPRDTLLCDLSTCEPCTGPTEGSGHAECVAGEAPDRRICAVICDTGSNLCGPRRCVPESPTSCGPGCADCTQSLPAHAAGVCRSDHTCDFVCEAGFLRCGGGCCRATSVAAGSAHTCAITDASGLLCWGANHRGQLGRGDVRDSSVPVEVLSSGAGVTAVAAGYGHTCAVVAGRVACWGANDAGQLGVAPAVMTVSSVPVFVAEITDAVLVAAGGGAMSDDPSRAYGHTCVARADGAVACFGRNLEGQLGDRTLTSRHTPATVVGLPVVAGGAAGRLAAGAHHTCAVASNGALYCWGGRERGQVGDGVTAETPHTQPFEVLAADISFVIAGALHACAIVTPEAERPFASCWGANQDAQLGTRDLADRLSPTPAALGGLDSLRPTAAAAGRGHTCLLRAFEASGLKCFGADTMGQLGTPPGFDPGRVSEPVFSPTDPPTVVTAGRDHTCVLLASGAISCFGANDRGQLGDETTIPRSAPTLVSGRGYE